MELIKELRKRMTKYKISKELGVSWQAVHSWEKGFNKPTKEHEAHLLRLMKQK